MKVDLQKVVDFIRKRAGEIELEGFRREKESPEFSASCFAQAFAVEEVADQLEVTPEILDDPEEKDNSISIVWWIEDVHQVAEQMKVTISDEDAREILKIIDRSHDANFGVNWEIIEIFINFYLEEKEKNV